MSDHADTIRPTIRHDKMRVVDTWSHPAKCPGCAADAALDELVAERQQAIDERYAAEQRRDAAEQAFDRKCEALRQAIDALREIAASTDEPWAHEHATAALGESRRDRMKLAWFQGDAQKPEDTHWQDYRSQDAIMEFAETKDARTPILRLLLVPDDVDLRTLHGDDWNDAPADANASQPYDPPEGSMWLDIRLGNVLSVSLGEKPTP